MTHARGALGAEGERRAARWLERRGYRITARNVRVEGVEVDLIALRRGVVVFVEVKTRSSRRAGAPEEAVDAAKQRRLVRAAAGWLRAHPRAGRHARFDVVACERDASGAWSIRHLEGAFDASP